MGVIHIVLFVINYLWAFSVSIKLKESYSQVHNFMASCWEQCHTAIGGVRNRETAKRNSSNKLN